MKPRNSSFKGPGSGPWNRVFGRFQDEGLGIDWVEFQTQSDFDSTEAASGPTLELCLNLEGAGEVRTSTGVMMIHAASLGAYLQLDAPIETRRFGGQRHRYVRVRMAPGYLTTLLGAAREGLAQWASDFIERRPGESGVHAINQPIPLLLGAERLFEEIVTPPVAAAGRDLWYRGKVTELVARCLCEPQEYFCSRQKRVAMDRVEKACSLIRERLENPPALPELGKAAGCSPAYLSRTFTMEMGMTVSQFIRQARIERAAELLRDGRRNVTEVAMEVGYSSLSHFSKAFREITGCCPGLYPFGKAVVPGR